MNCYYKLLARNQFLEFLAKPTANVIGLVFVNQGRQGVDGVAVEHNINLDQVRSFVARGVVVKRSVSARNRLEPVIKVKDNLGKGHFKVQLHAVCGQVALASNHSPLVDAQGHNPANIL